ncbi:MAG: hypothetical protein ACPGIC_01060 [Opitutales bacterium]
MKCLRALLLPTLLFTGFLPLHTHARIGESRESLERRLLSSGGIVYRDDTIEANRLRGMPYVGFLSLLEEPIDVRIYFKTADGRRPQTSELDAGRMGAGWDLHVVYLRGVSVIEVYKRSSAINRYELNALLAQQAGGSFWKRIPKDKKEPSALGYDMLRDDGSLRARRVSSNALMIFNTKTDLMFHTLREQDQEETAPISVDGF